MKESGLQLAPEIDLRVMPGQSATADFETTIPDAIQHDKLQLVFEPQPRLTPESLKVHILASGTQATRSAILSKPTKLTWDFHSLGRMNKRLNALKNTSFLSCAEVHWCWFGSPKAGWQFHSKRKVSSRMRHIPKLAALVGSVTIGILGLQGVAGASTHDHQGFIDFPKSPPIHNSVGDWWLLCYPGPTKSTPPPPLYPVVFHDPSHGGKSFGGGYKLTSSVHHKP